jgi:hypothetical protein
MRNIPFARHCNRNVRTGTLFPSLQATIQEKNRRVEEDGDLYRDATLTLRRGGSGLPLGAGLEETVAGIDAAEGLQIYNTRRGI